ncbi:MAG: 23S rRNA (pseudouridine(1915)-N(3))-methyltransferase RlmH [Rickettsiaceae bacterium]|nr:23S rRNA (pseudouridine(1915)-N(3))-methyltransferase RlmH [Rickettsiaceae bacterium]
MSNHILIVSIGKASKEYRCLMDHWANMIKYKFSEKELVCKKPLSPAQLKTEEAGMIGQHIIKDSVLVVLDPVGKKITSEEFAKFIDKNISGAKDITFVIGGAHGVDKTLVQKADLVLSLSDMTMPHMLAKLVLLEQIYRAQTIIQSHPYHK